MFILHLLPPPHPKEEASTNQVADQHMPVYDLPSKILCRVINVQLKAEPDTDEVLAQITLLPEQNQDENAVDKEPPLPPRCRLLPCTLCLHLDKWSLRLFEKLV
ncbi:auxin response factor 2 isoform X5 [Arachis ipaensis]|uniref:auxin response factor 2 isoform X5 n=2 Tax=Arachis ipaensis TaxID=130454 RepID=UPI000A2B71C4|nr:auxin response factor 2 isoform X5 [Arachis ipaensis]